MIGYWGNDDATRETMSDGWIRTGDMARNEGEGTSPSSIARRT